MYLQNSQNSNTSIESDQIFKQSSVYYKNLSDVEKSVDMSANMMNNKSQDQNKSEIRIIEDDDSDDQDEIERRNPSVSVSNTNDTFHPEL